jgi:UDP-N-acetylmuramoyl-L-alanyl-D-glutamate--2,6-diaminopimelate ligase
VRRLRRPVGAGSKVWEVNHGLPRPRPRADPARLSVLARAVRAELRGPDRAVTGCTAASTLVRPGDLFVALGGTRTHGIGYAEAARAAGAVAVLVEPSMVDRVPAGLPALVTVDPRAAVGRVAALVYGEPSKRLSVVGVTGTSGKTTTTFLARDGLQAAGRAVGLIGTVGTFVGDEELHTGFTTPEAAELQALLAVMADRGCTDVLMEVSSHGLALGRVAGTRFVSAGFTNLSRDHLDFHPSMADYFATKATLFDRWAERARIVVDDEWGARLATQTVADDVQTVGTVAEAVDWRAEDVVTNRDGSSDFVAVGPFGKVAAGCAIPGGYNVANALLALALVESVGVPPAVAAPAVAAAHVPGRMERIDRGQPYLALVDYAHKPAAVAAALRTLRRLTPGRVITVLGCGGDRDQAKRPLMGQVAAEGSDVLVITDDNPRSESAATIRAQMRAGVTDASAEVREIGDRAEAISAAVAMARPGDTVLVAGKGHEPGQEVAGVVHPFDDRVVLAAALEAAARGAP